MGDFRVRFAVLGPLQASRAGESLPLGGPQQRLTLALLLAEFGRAVPIEKLIDSIWGGTPPATARKTLQVYVSHLRNVVGVECIQSEAGGYRVANATLDASEFEALCNRGWAEMREDPRAGGDLLAEALGLWMGPPYAGLDDNRALQAEAVRLEELRVAALEGRIDADLAAGSDSSLVGELEALVRDHPFRERFGGQLMLALYRAGRQAEALRTFGKTRALLAEELGIEPGPDLWELEQRILDQDPSLIGGGKPVGRSSIRAIKSYEIRELAGEGPFGVVYRAFDRGSSRRVGVKAIRREVANQPKYIARFEPAMQLLIRLDHPHILSTFDHWRDVDGAYLVLPWMDGGSLGAALSDSRPWAPGPALKLIGEIGGALSYAHRNGVVHGSVKPNNVLFDREGTAHLADFPVMVAREGPHVAPEVADGESPTPRADVYSLGLIIHQLFTGTLPDQRESASRLLAPQIQHVIRRAIARDPSHRFDRVDELQRGIRRATGADVVGMAEGSAASSRRPRNPYKGLRAFQEADAEDFYGREELIDLALEKIASHRLVAVVGPSGSGKSSLVKAGVIPRLRAEGRTLITEMYPGNQPFEELEAALRRAAVRWPERGVTPELTADSRGLLRVVKQILPDDDSEMVLVVDQFEELFSLLDDSEARTMFLESLANVATDAHSRVRVLVTLRADFFDRPLEYSEFGTLLEAGVVPVANPSRQDLAQAVSQPAQRVGMQFEPGLISEIVSDFADQPGGLPLLQFTLTEMTEHGDGRELTAEDYAHRGRVGGAIGARAEQVYIDQRPPGRHAVEQAFLRMVQVGEEGGYTRRRVNRAELTALGVDRAALSQALQAFAEPRLLTFDRDPITRGATVEVAHEALLREWPRLGSWIDERREDLVTRRRLHDALEEWRASEEDDGYLPSGSRLAQFAEWANGTQLSLSVAERAFLQAAVKREGERKARAGRRRRRIMAGFVLAAAISSVFGIVALRNADTARAEALAAAALEQLDDDPERSVLLALQSLAVADTPNGLTALHQALGNHRTLWANPPACPTAAPSFECGPGPFAFLHPDGRHVVTATWLGRVSYWDAESDAHEPLWTTELTAGARAGMARPWIDSEENVVVLPYSDLGDPEFGGSDLVDGQHRGLYTLDLDTGELVDYQPLDGCVTGHSFPPPSADVAEPAIVTTRFPPAENDPTKCDLAAFPEIAVRQNARSDWVAMAIPRAAWESPNQYWDISTDGQRFTFSASDTGASVFDTNTGEVVKSYPEADRATLSRDARRILLYTGWFEGAERVELREIASDEIQLTIPGRFEWIRFTPDETLLVGLVQANAAVKVVDPSSGELARELVGPEIRPFLLRFDANSSRVLVNYGFDFRLWDLGSTASEVDVPIPRVLESDEQLDRAGVTVGGDLVFVPGYVEGQFGYAVYDVDGELVRRSSSGRGFMSPDGSVIVENPVLDQGVRAPSGREGMRMARPRLVDARTGVVIQELPSTCTFYALGLAEREPGTDCDEDDVVLDITDVDFSRDHDILAVETIGGAPTVFDLSENEMIFHEDVPVGHGGSLLQRIAVSPSGDTVIYEDPSVGESIPSGIKAVELRTGETIRESETCGVSRAVFSSDGARLYVSDFCADILVFETDSWDEVARFGRPKANTLADIAVSGDLVAMVGTDNIVRAWDVDGDDLLLEVPVDATPRNVEFLDETHILVTTVEGEVLAFTLDPEELRSIAAGRLTRGFTEEECRAYEIAPCPALAQTQAEHRQR